MQVGVAKYVNSVSKPGLQTGMHTGRHTDRHVWTVTTIGWHTGLHTSRRVWTVTTIGMTTGLPTGHHTDRHVWTPFYTHSDIGTRMRSIEWWRSVVVGLCCLPLSACHRTCKKRILFWKCVYKLFNFLRRHYLKMSGKWQDFDNRCCWWYCIKLEKLLDAKRSRLMPPPGLQIHLRPRMTLTFDLLVPRVDRFMPFPREPLVIQNTDERTNEPTDRSRT